MKRILPILLVALVALFSNCGDDDNGNGNGSAPADPEGTITVNLSWTGYWGPNSTHTISLNFGHYWVEHRLMWSSPDNIEIACDYYEHYISVAHLGSMGGLGNIKSIPESGWSPEYNYQTGNISFASERKNGYVIKFRDTYDPSNSFYARMYIVEPIVNTSNGIFGAKVKLQYPFEP